MRNIMEPERTSTESDPDRLTATDLLIEGRDEPDLMLKLSTGGKIGPVGITLLALVSAVIVGIVLYGLNTGTQ